MQNKWFVGSMAVPALALTGLTLWAALTQNWLLGAVPAAAAVLLFRGAWWAARGDSFGSSARRQVGDIGTSVGLARWQQHCADRDAAAAVKAAAKAQSPPPSKT